MEIKKTTPVQLMKNHIKSIQLNIAYEKGKIVELKSISKEDYEAFIDKIEDYMEMNSFITMVADFNSIGYSYIDDFKMPPFREVAYEINKRESMIGYYEKKITDYQKRIKGIKEKTNEAQIKKDGVIDALVDAGLTKVQAEEIIEKNSI